MSFKSDFLMSYPRYRGAVQPENLVFNANLQEFALRVNYITNLESSGKLSPEETYSRINSLWHELKRSKQQLGIGTHPFRPDNPEP